RASPGHHHRGPADRRRGRSPAAGEPVGRSARNVLRGAADGADTRAHPPVLAAPASPPTTAAGGSRSRDGGSAAGSPPNPPTPFPGREGGANAYPSRTGRPMTPPSL